MNYMFLPEALAEFEQAVTQYDQCGLGLGDEFTAEVEAGIQRILSNPEAWTLYHHHTRRCLTHRFPFAIVYRIRSNFIVIVAIAHLRREPAYWVGRTARARSG